MAGDWIKMRVWIEKDPKTIRMADILATTRAFMDWVTDPVQRQCDETLYEHVHRNVTVRVTVAGLLRVWGVSRELGKRDGDDLVLKHASLKTLEDIAGLPGFGDAMSQVGWAKETKNGDIVFPNYLRDNECLEDRAREQNAERQRRYREKKRHSEGNSRNVTRNVMVTQQSNVREEKIINTPLNPPADAGGLSFGSSEEAKTVEADWKRRQPAAILGEKDRRRIDAALAIGFTPGQLSLCLDGYFASCPETPTLRAAFRDGDTISGWIAKATRPPPSLNTSDRDREAARGRWIKQQLAERGPEARDEIIAEAERKFTNE